MAKSDDPIARTFQRAQELKDDSLDWSHAHGRARLEYQINEAWPTAWGDDLQVIIYGDFNPPDSKIHDKQLGITVYPEKLHDTVIRSALCALKVIITLSDKSITSVMSAIRRLNLFLGAMTLTSWGNNKVSWWCHLTHGNTGVGFTDWEIDEILQVTKELCALPDAVRQRVDSALYWMRATPALILGQPELHVYRAFVSRWNAFECLVEAIHIYRPEPTLSKAEKQISIDHYMARCEGRLTAQRVEELYRSVVNPGFVGRAKHALRVCFEDDASEYIHECFERPDRNNCFYEIRNAINHGDIDAENPEERIRIESRFSLLQLMILQLFARIVPYSSPAIEGFTRHVSRQNEGISG